MILWMVGGAVVLLVLVAGGWFLLARSSRRDKELASGPRRFHWAMIAAYRGDADPTQLSREEAGGILKDGWSQQDPDQLRRLLSKYRSGEINAAFDAVRVAWLAELAVAAGWFSIDEAMQWSEPEWRRVRGAHRTWAEYESALLEGRARWWAEIARKPMPESERARSVEIRAEAKQVFDSVAFSDSGQVIVG
ncbi:MAG TPA: DUF1266 domain-containing protein [Polyangiaceae bacterium]